jgi:hypothetical protein
MGEPISVSLSTIMRSYERAAWVAGGGLNVRRG